MSHPPGNSHKISGAGPASARPLDRWGAILATGLGLGMFAPSPGTWGAAVGVPLAVAVAMLPWGAQP
ncbi:MAG: hypothetical protein KDA41_02455, partial [Planctomycetales bacterium]|nr:hypothetical protein [Planctomycetales bacterium]